MGSIQNIKKFPDFFPFKIFHGIEKKEVEESRNS